MLLVGAPYCTVRSIEPHSQSDDVKLQWEESVIGFNMSVRWQAAIRHGTRPRWLAGSMVDCGSCCVDAAPICWGCGLVETRGPIRAERRGQPRFRLAWTSSSPLRLVPVLSHCPASVASPT